MARLGIVHCRVCKKPIDRNKLTENIDWVMPSKNWFYHIDCYKTWCEGKSNYKDITKKETQEEYLENIKYYLYKDLKINVNFSKLTQQIQTFLKRGYTLKGILFTLIYFYDIQKGSIDKSQGGIGIVPYVYEDAKQYWIEQTTKQYDILNIIEKQIEQRRARDTIIIKKKDKTKKIVSHLEEIGELEDE